MNKTVGPDGVVRQRRHGLGNSSPIDQLYPSLPPTPPLAGTTLSSRKTNPPRDRGTPGSAGPTVPPAFSGATPPPHAARHCTKHALFGGCAERVLSGCAQPNVVLASHVSGRVTPLSAHRGVRVYSAMLGTPMYAWYTNACLVHPCMSHRQPSSPAQVFPRKQLQNDLRHVLRCEQLT